MLKDILPLKSFHYGLFYHQDQKASVSIGPLVCEGMKPLPTFAKDCKSIKDLGQPDGYYITQNETSKALQITNCSTSDEESFQINDDTVVNFMAIKTTGCWINKGNYITNYGKLEIDENGNFDLASGKFTAPFSGIYKFDFFGYAYQYTIFHVKNNDSIVLKTKAMSSDVISLSWQMNLIKGDVMRIYMTNYHYSHCLCSSSNDYNTVLNGKLLQMTN